MKKNNNYLDLATSIDVLNTLNGGVTEPKVDSEENETYRVVRLKVAGVDKEHIHVEVHNNTLTIYFYILVTSGDKLIQVPQIVYNKVVPYFIDINKITATFEEHDLVVKLPFNKLSNGYHKKIRIDEN